MSGLRPGSERKGSESFGFLCAGHRAATREKGQKIPRRRSTHQVGGNCQRGEAPFSGERESAAAANELVEYRNWPLDLLSLQTIPLHCREPNIRFVVRRESRPGPRKVQRLPIGSRRTCHLVQCIDYSWRELFEKGDVVSEGAVRDETGGPVYYGSTSVVLASSLHGGGYPDAHRETVLQLLMADPHARARAVRIACLEAQLRARRSIETVRAELTFRLDPRGVRVDIDVEARVALELTAGGRS